VALIKAENIMRHNKSMSNSSNHPNAAVNPGRKPRVALILLDAGVRHGTAHAAHELIRRARDTYDFAVISTRLAAEMRPLAEFLPVPAPRGPFRLRWLAFYLFAGMRLASARADLVHTLAPAPLVPNRVDLATIMCSQVAYYEAEERVGGAGEWLARLCAAWIENHAYGPGRTRMLSALAPGGKRELERHHPGVPVVLTPHVLQLERFYPDEPARREVRHELGAGPGEIVVCFVNNTYWEHKGLKIAIGGLSRAARSAPAFGLLWVVGSGPVDRFREYARERGVDHRVRFLGHRADMERIYRGADFLVHPARYETFSLAVHEAAATGIPVIATRTNGVEDLLEDGRAGMLVERTEEAVADAMVRLARDPELRVRMGNIGRERVLKFGPERFTAGVREAYRYLLESSH
jgi:glycosyltransferase involved in cell wall biosynthesis